MRLGLFQLVIPDSNSLMLCIALAYDVRVGVLECVVCVSSFSAALKSEFKHSYFCVCALAASSAVAVLPGTGNEDGHFRIPLKFGWGQFSSIRG